MDNFRFNIPTQVYFGPGTLEKLGEIAGTYGKKAFVVTGGKSSKSTGLLDRVTRLLKSSGIDTVVFDKVTPNPQAATVREGTDIIKRVGCDFVVALGGGSPMDAAKAIACCSVSPGDILDYLPGGKYAKTGLTGGLPLIAITTTAGTGSEVNKVSVITDGTTKRKMGFRSIYMYPSVSIVDPEIMVALPARATAATGMDAFYHAMESYLSINANRFSEILSLEAMRLVAGSLENAVRNGADLEARANMAWASTLAGIALDHAGAIAVHATSHPVGAYYNAVHGEILSATAPTYCKYHYRDNIPKFAVIAGILGCSETGSAVEERAAKSGDCLDNLLKKVGMNVRLSDMGVTEDMIDTLTKNALETMVGPLANTPGKVGYEELNKIYKASI